MIGVAAQLPPRLGWLPLLGSFEGQMSPFTDCKSLVQRRDASKTCQSPIFSPSYITRVVMGSNTESCECSANIAIGQAPSLRSFSDTLLFLFQFLQRRVGGRSSKVPPWPKSDKFPKLRHVPGSQRSLRTSENFPKVRKVSRSQRSSRESEKSPRGKFLGIREILRV